MPTIDYIAELLGSLDIAFCEFDASNRTVRWNRTFLEFFPEHAEIYRGEAYEQNLRRFYRARLSCEELGEIERYVAEGVVRHQQQQQPFSFWHRERQLRVSSLPMEDGGRVRIWREVAGPGLLPAQPMGLPIFDALNFIADGATVLDAQDRIVAANNAFRTLYDVPEDRVIVGLTLDQIIAGAWRVGPALDAMRATIRNGLRYDGAPFEVELPGNRWRRIIARHTGDGNGYFTHVDVTALRRQHRELIAAQEALRKANAELARLAREDPLTRLANRRSFEEALAIGSQRGTSFALILIDIDSFKSINDRFGHLAGDACLRRVATTIAASSAPFGGVVARIGGEEFAVIAAGLAAGDVGELAELIRRDVEAANWRMVHPEIARITISLGVCIGTGPAPAETVQATADEALYAAKRLGRNRIETMRLDTGMIRRSA